jgi:hypothetical protein
VRALALAVALCACTGLRTGFDAGEGGGAATGGGSGAAGGGSATGGGGGANGGGTSTNGGGTAAGGGGAGAWQFAALTLSAATEATITGISGTSADLWALSSWAGLFHSTGGTFTAVTGLSLSPGRGVWVAGDGSVFLAYDQSFSTCRSSCDQAAHHASTSAGSGFDVQAVCGNSPTDVYGVAEDPASHAAVLWHWDGNAWTQQIADLGIRYPRACTALSDLTIVVAGLQDVALVAAGGGVSTEHAATSPPLATLSEAASQQWDDVALVGTR